MSIDRRSFLVTGATAGLGLASGIRLRGASAAEPTPKAELRFSSQGGQIPGNELNEKFDWMEKNGFVGYEPGGGGLAGNVEKINKALEGRKLKVSAVCAGFKAGMISEDETVRRQSIDSIKELLVHVGAIKAVGLVAVPAFNGQTKLEHSEARKVLLAVLPEIGEQAVKCGTKLILEPLRRGESYFLRQCGDAAQICREVNHPGVTMMGDFHHMGWEEPNWCAAFLAGGKYLAHVHMGAFPARILPGQVPEQDPQWYIDGFKGLKMIGYQGYCSYECGVRGDKTVEVPKSLQFLREQWEKAVV